MAQGLREKISFERNVPVVVTFDRFTDGKLSPSARSGADQYMYTFRDDRIAWVDPEVHERIQACRPKPGDTLSITRRERRVNQQRYTEWVVEPAPPITPEMDEPAVDPDPVNWPKHQLDTPAPTNGSQAKRPAAATAADFDRLNRQREAEERMNANGGRPPAPAPAAASGPRNAPQQPPAIDSAPAAPSRTAAMFDSLTQAIDVATLAARYAQEKGLQLNWTTEDIRSIALSIYISRTREIGGNR